MRIQVLYDDNHVIAVFKPAGLLVQGDESGDPSLMDEVKKFLKEKYNKPGDVFLGLVHRLDRNVSGIVLFGKTSKGAARLSEQFRNRTVIKKYTALVEGLVEQGGTITHYLRKEADRIATVRNEPFEGASRADLSYEVIKANPSISLLEITLETGRFHQIRAQLAAIGHPIVGDVKYGAHQKMKNNEIALCATSLTFKQATSEKIIALKISVPKWSKL